MMISRKSRRLLLAGAVLMMAALVFLMTSRRHPGEEAWARFQQEMAAKQEVLEWQAFIPHPVLEEENFFKAPGMAAWFTRGANRAAILELPPWERNGPVTLAQLRAASEERRSKLRQWFTAKEAEYGLLIEAAARPFARFEGNLENPTDMDVPNFVNLRNVAQALATHASLSLLDGEEDMALQDLTMVRRLADLAGSSPTLAGAMIQAALMDLYFQTAREAVEGGELSDRELAAIQMEIEQVNLVEVFARAMRAQRAVGKHLVDLPREELLGLLPRIGGNQAAVPSAAFWRVDWKGWIQDLRFRSKMGSRKWLLANMTTVLRQHQGSLDQIDPMNQRIHAGAFDLAFRETQTALARPSQAADLASLLMPNYSRAALTMGRTQTQLNQLLIACALERHRLAHHQHPERLESLSPAFLERIPPDLFSDQPLQYQRLPSGGYKLWSIGWDETDDGGTCKRDINGRPIFEKDSGDWVWEMPSP